MEDVVAHLVAHDGLNFFRRAAAQQVVVEGDAHGAGESADVGAHAGGLAAGVDLVDIVGRDAVGVGHAQDGHGDARVVEEGDLIEDGLEEDRRRWPPAQR